MRVLRQGDVLLVPINTGDVPEGMKPIKRENGQIILAHGEVTGHSHSILGDYLGQGQHNLDRVELLAPDADQLVTADEAAELYLLVHGTEPVELTHQEHATITVDPGAYRVVRQREYTPVAPVRVVD